MISGILAAGLLCVQPLHAAPQLSAVAQVQLDQGLIHLYNLDYEASRAAFRKIIELEPDNPFGYLFEAGGIWWQASQEYGLFKDTPTLQGLFEQDIEAAVRKAESYIDSNNAQLRADGLFVSGMALGTRGQWDLMKGKWIDAYLDGKKAVKRLKRCVKLDPEYYDAYLGLGVFDYQTAHLSGVAKLGFLLGMHGDEKRGLERMHLAMDKARYARRQAAQFLSAIYMSDLNDYARALPVVRQLRTDFPESSYFLFLDIVIRHHIGDWQGSFTSAQTLHARIAAHPEAFRRKWLTFFCGLSGEQCLSERDLNSALSWLDRALDGVDGQNDSFTTALTLLRAYSLDSLGRREEAVKAYQHVEKMPTFFDSHENADACLAEPCTRDVLLSRMRLLSKGPSIAPMTRLK